MKKNIAIGFLISLGLLITISLLVIYYLELPLDGFFIQLIILNALIGLNILYLFFLLLEIDYIVAAVSALLFGSFGLLYNNLSLKIDPRLQALYMLLALIVITVVIRLALRKSWPR